MYDATGVRYQDPNYSACVATSTMMMLNSIDTRGTEGEGFLWTHTTSSTTQTNILAFDRAYMTQVQYHGGADAHGWRNGLNYYGWGRDAMTDPTKMVYKDLAYSTYTAAVKAAIQAIARYNNPVGFMGWAGGHAQFINGYIVYGEDPATSLNFTVQSVYITDPLHSDYARNLKLSNHDFQFGSTKYRFRAYIYTDSPSDDRYTPGTTASYKEWLHKWVIIAPVRTPTEAPTLNPTPIVLPRRDTTRPTVAGRSPAPGRTYVDRDHNITVRFSEGVRNVTSKTLRLVDTRTGRIVSARVSYNASTHVATLNPTYREAAWRWYRVYVRTGITDLSNNAIVTTSWLFKTGAY
ncbi:MAG: Ig-like domain-containing protein [Chloroflexota bacterium]